MSNEHAHASPPSDQTRPFHASVSPNPDGGWLAIVNVGDGASLTKWFERKEQAEGYGDELAAWLEQRREEPT
jgi:hypothetical protein